MKRQGSIIAVLQILLFGAVELVLLTGLVAVMAYGAWKEWPMMARAVVFFAGFILFALPVVFISQRPYHQPAWAGDVRAQGQLTTATLLSSPYAGEEWQPKPGDWMVQMSARLEGGLDTSMLCRLEQARRLRVGEQVTVHFDPARPERCVLAAQRD